MRRFVALSTYKTAIRPDYKQPYGRVDGAHPVSKAIGALGKPRRLSPLTCFYFCVLALLLITMGGCQAGAPTGESAGNSQEPAGALEAASTVGRAFLDAWLDSDYDNMHSLLSFRSQELVNILQFRRLYVAAARSMALERMEYQPQAISSDRGVISFHYAMTFHSRVLGSFEDEERRLHMVEDARGAGWRIAWSRADIFAEMAQGAQLVFTEQIPIRGNIYSRGGQILADQNGRAARVLVDNRHIPQRERCFRTLAQVSSASLAHFHELFDERSGADWIVDAGLLEAESYIKHGDRIAADCGADFRPQETRRAVDGSLLPHVLGSVGYPDAAQVPALEAIGFHAESIIGKTGIEASMNDWLAGKPGGRLVLVATDGRELRLLAEARPQAAQSLWLTIDAGLQATVRQQLEAAYAGSSWLEDSQGAAVLVMDVNNGDILALASYPSYDNNILNPFPPMGQAVAAERYDALLADERLPLLNRPAQGSYPTGSVIKGMTALAALEHGVYTEDSRYICTGSWVQAGDLRFDWLPGGHGAVSVEDGVAYSCNPLFYEAGYRLNALDPWLLPKTARQLGLGQATGISLIQESEGLLPTPDNIIQYSGLAWNYSYAVNLAIGQGEFLATPLQMLRLYAAIVNGGWLLRPQLVRERGILDRRQPVAMREATATGLDSAHLELVRRGACAATSEFGGTAFRVFAGSPLHGQGVCGKTGTAQVPGEGKPPHSWFIAFTPAEVPRLVMVVMVENGGEGSTAAAPIARAILEAYDFAGA